MSEVRYIQYGMLAVPRSPRYERLNVRVVSGVSPRDPNGKLRLQANTFSLVKKEARMSNWDMGSYFQPQMVSFIVNPDQTNIMRTRTVLGSDLRNALTNKIRSGNYASLGVSISQARQSVVMLEQSANRLTSVISGATRLLRTTRGKKRLKRLRRVIARGGMPTASAVLEGMFGWAPLFGDFYSACQVIANPWPPAWVSSSKEGRVGDFRSASRGKYEAWTHQWTATVRCSYSCSVRVSNPNLWVANKLGLINPAQVAWDLVPWSFLVNMVSNFGQIAGSLTDFAGLSLSDTSLTTTVQISESRDYMTMLPGTPYSAGASGFQKRKDMWRSVGVAPPPVTPQVRLPGWSIGTAAIAGSLLIQQTNRLNRMLGL